MSISLKTEAQFILGSRSWYPDTLYKCIGSNKWYWREINSFLGDSNVKQSYSKHTRSCKPYLRREKKSLVRGEFHKNLTVMIMPWQCLQQILMWSQVDLSLSLLPQPCLPCYAKYLRLSPCSLVTCHLWNIDLLNNIHARGWSHNSCQRTVP